jgi:hypothetical protein
MPKIIRQLFAGTSVLVLICAAGCAARKGSKELSERLLKAAELPAVFVEGTIAGYRNGALRDGRPEKEINCVAAKVTPELVLPALTDAYSIEFSDDELRQGISFFESDTGKAYVRYQRNLAREMSGLSTEEVPEFSPPEVARIKDFTGTRLGKLILTPNSPMFASAREKLRQQIFAIFDDCRSAK